MTRTPEDEVWPWGPLDGLAQPEGVPTAASYAHCRHCSGEIIPCAAPSRFCGGWKHVAYLHYGPVGPHYCEGRSVNPLAEPAEMRG